MHKVLLLEKYNESTFFWENLLKHTRVPELTVEEVLHKYLGFEGELIFMSPIDKKEDILTLKDLFKDYTKSKKSQNYLLMHVISGGEKLPLILRNQMMFLGFDIGVCEEEKTIYSSIFHEILFGKLQELVSYKNQLNENFLFQNRNLAEMYVDLHNELSAQGKDVEDYEEMTIYEIWKERIRLY